MPRPTADEGINPYEIRVGVSVPRLKGMNRHDDPAAIEPNAHHLLVNTRMDGGEITDRPGSSLEYDSQQTACITGMIEFDDPGVGFWVTDAQKFNSPTDQKYLGNFNEENSTPYVRYNDKDDQEPPFISGDLYESAYDAGYNNIVPWNSVVNFRRKWLRLGQRQVVDEDDPSQTIAYVHLWEMAFPQQPGDAGPVGFNAYLDIENRNDNPDMKVASFATTFERLDDDQSGDVRIGELLYIGTNEGKVLVWDGATLQESLDMGGTNDYWVRLGSWPGGIFAVGSNNSGSAVAYVLPDGATSWSSVTLPTSDFFCTAMLSFLGKLYIFEAVNAGNAGRVFVYDGESSLPAYVHEWNYTDPTHYTSSAGLPFIYRKNLYVVTLRQDGAQLRWDLYRRVSDSNWTMELELNWRQDFAANVDWVIVANQRIIMGGLVIEKDVGQAGAGTGATNYLIWEVNTSFWAHQILYESYPDNISVGYDAFIVSPVQELDSEEV